YDKTNGGAGRDGQLKRGINRWTTGADSRITQVAGGVSNIAGRKGCHERRHLHVHGGGAAAHVVKSHRGAEGASTAVGDVVNIIDIRSCAGIARPGWADAAHHG